VGLIRSFGGYGFFFELRYLYEFGIYRNAYLRRLPAEDVLTPNRAAQTGVYSF
jgi:hypothetical protein